MEHRYRMFAPGTGSQEQKQDHHRHCFDTTGGRTGRAADEHQHRREGFARIRHTGLTNGIKTGGTHRHRLEKSVEYFLRRRHQAQSFRIVPLQRTDQNSAGQYQDTGGQKHQAGINTELMPMALCCHFFPYEETQTADHYQQHQSDAHHRIVIKGNDAVPGGNGTENIKAGIAKGGNGMENAPNRSLSRSEFRPEPQKQHQCASALNRKAADQHPFLEPDNTFDLIHAQGLGHEHTLLQTDLPPQHKNNQRSGAHKAQAADLDQKNNHCLTKAAPLSPGVEQHQSSHAGGRGCCKERRNKTAAFPIAGTDGQIQQQRAGQNNQGKYDGNDLSRRQFRPGFAQPKPELIPVFDHLPHSFPIAILLTLLSSLYQVSVYFQGGIFCPKMRKKQGRGNPLP